MFSDILPGDRKTANLFLQCRCYIDLGYTVLGPPSPTLLILAKPLPEAQKDKKREVAMIAVLADGRSGDGGEQVGLSLAITLSCATVCDCFFSEIWSRLHFSFILYLPHFAG